MKRSVLALIIAIWPASAGIITSSSAQCVLFPNSPVFPEQVVSDPSFCSLPFNFNQWTGIARASLGLFGTFGVTTTATALGADEVLVGREIVTVEAGSNASATRYTVIMPGGLPRPGFVHLSLVSAADRAIDGGALVTASFGSYTSFVDMGGCSGVCFPTQILPVTLGLPISVTIKAEAGGNGGFGNATLGALAQADYQATFFEANGTTPVSFTDVTATVVPEPRAVLLCALALGAMLSSRLTRRSSTSAVAAARTWRC
jgi:hypothetical protein